jgi:hypothetical protein
VEEETEADGSMSPRAKARAAVKDLAEKEATEAYVVAVVLLL